MGYFLNPRWPPRWQLKPINDHNFCSKADTLLKLEAKYRFSHMSNSNEYIKMTSGISKFVNPRWLPRGPPRSINGYNFCSRAHSLMALMAKT